MVDAIILSDIHLGSDNCQAKELASFLERIHSGQLETGRIILNGDVFDSFDFRRLNKNHWKVLSLLRKMSDDIEILWIHGNHDGAAEVFSHLLGVGVREEVILQSGSTRILIHHGHRFDQFIDRHPIVTACADAAYRMLQRIDRSHTFARAAKKRSKIFLRCSDKIRSESIELAQRMNCQAVCCGHTHHAIADRTGPVQYFNSGCWTERPCHYLSILDGQVELHQHQFEPMLEIYETSMDRVIQSA
jgi:UDP-2,3-diacylglucosamine pyrophosphatase LpxH